MRSLFTVILMASLYPLIATILLVDENGSGDYTSILTAIDASNDEDTLRVWPGEYRENINFNGQDITLESLYATTQDLFYVEYTRTIGQPTEKWLRLFEQTLAVV